MSTRSEEGRTVRGVTVSIAEGVATVIVDNPPVNALDDPTLEALGAAARSLAGVDDVRAIVLSGAGERAFLAGADLRRLREHLGVPAGLAEHVSITQPTFEAWSALRAPVIAAVQASAVGGGLEVALMCDLIVADPTARFGLPEVTLGLIPGGGGTQRLPRRIGQARALELMLTGRLIDAERAHEIGLVNVVSAPGEALAQAQALAERLAGLPKLAVQAVKQSARGALDTPLSDGLDAERALFLRVAASADAREGADAFLEKRPPAFAHR